MTRFFQVVLITTLTAAAGSAVHGADALDAARIKRATQELRISDGAVQRLTFPDKPVINHEIRFTFEQRLWTLRLEPFSVRSPDFANPTSTRALSGRKPRPPASHPRTPKRL